MSNHHNRDKYFYIGWTLAIWGATNSLFMWNELNYWRNRNNMYQSETSGKIRLDKVGKGSSGGEVIIFP